MTEIHLLSVLHNGAFATPVCRDFFPAASQRTPDLAHTVAAFTPTTRTLLFSEKQGTLNLLDMLVMYHEVFHGAQDVVWRDSINSQHAYENYVRFHTTTPGEKPRIPVMSEATAYAFELEVANIVLHGLEIREKARNETLTADFLGSRLEARADQRKLVTLLTDLAGVYFQEPIIESDLPARFVNTIADMYQSVGYELFLGDPTTGQLEKFR